MSQFASTNHEAQLGGHLCLSIPLTISIPSSFTTGFKFRNSKTVIFEVTNLYLSMILNRTLRVDKA